MKQNYFILIAVIFIALVFISCEALPFNFSSDQSWLIYEDFSEKKRTTLTVLFAKVERIGGWDFVETEAASLAPLYFWNEGCKVTAAEEKPFYAAGIQLREREYNFGWRTKKSLAIEVRIWPYDYESEGDALLYEQKMPIAVGRVVSVGEKSFSSSDTIGRLLSKAIEKAVKELSAYERKKNA